MAGAFTDLEAGFKEQYPQDVVEQLLNNDQSFRKELKRAVPGKYKVSEGLVTFLAETGAMSPMGQMADRVALPPSMDRTDIRLVLKPTNFAYTIELGLLTLGAANSSKSAFNGGEEQRNESNAIENLGWFMDSTYTGTHGTGRRARVLTDGSNNFVADVPEGVKLLREGLLLTGRSTDAGSVSGSFDAQRITDIARSTRTVTYASTDRTLTAGDHIHVTTVASQTLTSTFANGLRGLVDDGTILTTVHGKSRDTYPKLKAYVNSNGSVTRNLSEQLMVQAAHDIMEQSGKAITHIFCGPGQFEKYLEFVAPDKRVMASTTEPGSRAAGYKQGDFKLYVPGVDAVLQRSWTIVPREMYLLNMDHFYLYVSKELGPISDLTNTGMFQLTPGTANNHIASVVGYMLAQENIGVDRFDCQGVIRDLKDRNAGD